jgi:hypothetical protein
MEQIKNFWEEIKALYNAAPEEVRFEISLEEFAQEIELEIEFPSA